MAETTCGQGGDNDDMTRRLNKGNGLYSCVRRVPKHFADVDPRRLAEKSLNPRDLRQALKLRDFVSAEQERLWAALKEGGPDDACARYPDAKQKARPVAMTASTLKKTTTQTGPTARKIFELRTSDMGRYETWPICEMI